MMTNEEEEDCGDVETSSKSMKSATTTTTTTTSHPSHHSHLVGQILNMIGNVYLQQGDARKMMECFVEASRIYRRANIPESNLVIAGYNFYGLSKTLNTPCAPQA